MCRNACPHVYQHEEQRWCPDCRAEHERHLERQGELAAVALEHREFLAIPPATDAEWLARLDDIAPLVLELAEWAPLESMECPMCQGQKTIYFKNDCFLDAMSWIACPWCGGAGIVPDHPDWHMPDLSVRRAG